jgi:hypothetical protein
MSYIKYFLNYKILIFATFIITATTSFLFFNNKSYNAKVAFTVGTKQSFTSNLLMGSFAGVKQSSGSFNNLVNRLYNLASSQYFFRGLTLKARNEKQFSYIEKIAMHNQSLLRQLFEKKEEYLTDEMIVSHMTDFLSKTTYVRLKDENQLILSTTTKNKKLTSLIQQLIKKYAKDILTKEPINEAKKAYEIVKQKVADIESKISLIDQKKVEIQQNYSTLDPEEATKRYAELRILVQKELITKEAKYKTDNKLIKKLKNSLRMSPFADYETRERIVKLQRQVEGLKSEITASKKSLADIEAQNKFLPTIILQIDQLNREQDTLLKELYRLNEQKNVADISTQKIQEAMMLRSIDESIKSPGFGSIIGKTIITAIAFTFFCLVSLYYMQTFIPTLFSKEELELSGINVAASFSYFLSKKNKTRGMGEVSVDNLAIDDFVKKNILTTKRISFTSIDNDSDGWNIIYLTIKRLIEEKKSIYLLNFNLSLSEKRDLDRLQKYTFGSFRYDNVKNAGSTKFILDESKLNLNLNIVDSCDYIIVNGSRLKSIPNKAVVLSLCDSNYVFTTLFKSKLSNVNNFINFYNIVTQKIKGSIELLVTNSSPNDNIGSYIKQSKQSFKDTKEDENNIIKLG